MTEDTILQSRTAPSAQRLRLLRSGRDWTACRQLLAYLGTNLSVLARLNDFYMATARPWTSSYPFTDYDEVVLRFVALRKIQRLSIPHLGEDVVAKLRSEFNIVVVCVFGMTPLVQLGRLTVFLFLDASDRSQ